MSNPTGILRRGAFLGLRWLRWWVGELDGCAERTLQPGRDSQRRDGNDQCHEGDAEREALDS